jgi:hypothetical protein
VQRGAVASHLLSWRGGINAGTQGLFLIPVVVNGPVGRPFPLPSPPGSRLVYRFTTSRAIYRVYQGRSFLPAPGRPNGVFYQGSVFYQVPSIYQGSESLRAAG